MSKHEVVNQIIDYLDVRRNELAVEMSMISIASTDYNYLEGSLETYDHLIAKLEDDYR